MARWCVGDAELAEEARQAEATAERIGESGAVAIIRMARAVSALSRQGDLEAFERFARWFIDFSVRNDFPWKLAGASWLGLASFWRGGWDDARAHIARSLEFEQQMRHPRTAFSVWSNAVMVKAYTGDGDVGALLDEKLSLLPQPGGRNSNGAWGLLLKTVEARALLGQRDAAASLYPLVLEALDTGTVTEFQSMELLQTGAGTGGRGWWTVGGGRGALPRGAAAGTGAAPPDCTARGAPLVCSDAARPQGLRRRRPGTDPARRSGRDVRGDRNAPASRDGERTLENGSIGDRSQETGVRRTRRPGGLTYVATDTEHIRYVAGRRKPGLFGRAAGG